MLLSCTGKDPAPVGFVAPVIEEVQAVRGADFSEVIITCRVSSAEGIKEYGVMFGEEELLAVPAENLSGNVFSVSIGGLAYSTTYHYQARSFSKTGVWKTEDEVPPAPIIKSATPLPGTNDGTIVFTLAIPGWDYVTQKQAVRCGVCYSQENGEPTLADFKAEAPSITEDGEAGLQIGNLLQGASCHFRAYSRLGTQVSYSETLTINIPSAAAVVVTLVAQSVTATSALLCGAVSNEWLSLVSAYGFELGQGQKILASNIDSDGLFSLHMNLNSQSSYTFRAFAVINNGTFYGEPMSFSTPEIVYPDEEYVDLGLDVLWATRNIGAENSYDKGDPYAWGETETKDDFSQSTYKWYYTSGNTLLFSKYNNSDHLTKLEPEDDAATVNWGYPWRTPDTADWDDLFNNCKWEQISDGERLLIKVVSLKEGYKDRFIFFPNETVIMSSNLSNDINMAYIVNTSNTAIFHGKLISMRREKAFYVRPVRDKNPNQTNQ